MARNRTSVLADTVELISLMPWWLGVALAAASYAGLHLLAVRELAPTGPHDIATGVQGAFIKGLSTVLQYAVPAACLAGAAVSAVTRHRRRKLAGEVAPEHAALVKDMTWPQFQTLLAEAFKNKGYIVKERRGRVADAGVDLELIRGGDRVLVHCRQWRAAKVAAETVRELSGIMAAKAASRGFVVTSGQFTGDAREFARGRNIELIDGARLYAMFHDVRIAQTVPEHPGKVIEEPACPKCGAKMVKRIAKKGAKRGQPFWGCSTFPACNGARPL